MRTLLPHSARKSGLVRENKEKRTAKGRSFDVSAAAFYNKTAHHVLTAMHIPSVMHLHTQGEFNLWYNKFQMKEMHTQYETQNYKTDLESHEEQLNGSSFWC